MPNLGGDTESKEATVEEGAKSELRPSPSSPSA